LNGGLYASFVANAAGRRRRAAACGVHFAFCRNRGLACLRGDAAILLFLLRDESAPWLPGKVCHRRSFGMFPVRVMRREAGCARARATAWRKGGQWGGWALRGVAARAAAARSCLLVLPKTLYLLAWPPHLHLLFPLTLCHTHFPPTPGAQRSSARVSGGAAQYRLHAMCRLEDGKKKAETAAARSRSGRRGGMARARRVTTGDIWSGTGRKGQRCMTFVRCAACYAGGRDSALHSVKAMGSGRQCGNIALPSGYSLALRMTTLRRWR